MFFIFVLGMSGKKVEFASFPFKYMTAFSVESSGTFSRTVKSTMFISKIDGRIKTDYGKKDNDIFEINNALANKIMTYAVHLT